MNSKIKHLIDHEKEFMKNLRNKNKQIKPKTKNIISLIKFIVSTFLFTLLFHSVSSNINVFFLILVSASLSLMLLTTLEVLFEIKNEENKK